MEGHTGSAPASLAGFAQQDIRKVSYEEISQGIEALCDLISASPDGWSPDAIVAVVRGGLVPATHVCHYFNRPIFFIYNDVLLDEFGGHHRILIVDEINDTGRAFQRIREKVFGSPPNDSLDTRYAALYTRHTTGFKADYFLDFEPYLLKTAAWQLFPWERE